MALELAVTDTLKARGIAPDMIIGHSLGEYTALSAKGVLSISDTIHLVGLLMEKHLTPHTRHAGYRHGRGANVDHSGRGWPSALQRRLRERPRRNRGRGAVQEIETLQGRMAAETVRSTLLRDPFGFHSAQVEPVPPEFQEIVRGVVSKPRISLLSECLSSGGA